MLAPSLNSGLCVRDVLVMYGASVGIRDPVVTPSMTWRRWRGCPSPSTLRRSVFRPVAPGRAYRRESACAKKIRWQSGGFAAAARSVVLAVGVPSSHDMAWGGGDQGFEPDFITWACLLASICVREESAPGPGSSTGLLLMTSRTRSRWQDFGPMPATCDE